MRALVAGNPDPRDEGWEDIRNIETLRRMVKKKTRATFSAHPVIVDYYDQLFVLLKELGWRRNVLTHGEYSLSHTEAGPIVRASSIVGDERKIITVTVDLVEQLAHDIAIATALLTFPLKGDDVPCALPSQERSIVRAFVESNHPNGSIETIPEYLR